MQPVRGQKIPYRKGGRKGGRKGERKGERKGRRKGENKGGYIYTLGLSKKFFYIKFTNYRKSTKFIILYIFHDKKILLLN